MADLFTLENLTTLMMLILLQAVLGFDNLLYISIESNRVEPARRSYVRKVGIALSLLVLSLGNAISCFIPIASIAVWKSSSMFSKRPT